MKKDNLKEFVRNTQIELDLLLRLGDHWDRESDDEEIPCYKFSTNFEFKDFDSSDTCTFIIKYVCTDITSDAIIDMWLEIIHNELEDKFDGKYDIGLDIDRVKYTTGIKIEFKKSKGE